jgi:phosphate/sulfate permease
VFAFASGASDVANAPAEAIATGMRSTFGVATVLIGLALAIARAGRRVALRSSIARPA